MNQQQVVYAVPCCKTGRNLPYILLIPHGKCKSIHRADWINCRTEPHPLLSGSRFIQLLYVCNSTPDLNTIEPWLQPFYWSYHRFF
jgi:hypothetical protein